jgi:hypothetical protein
VDACSRLADAGSARARRSGAGRGRPTGLSVARVRTGPRTRQIRPLSAGDKRAWVRAWKGCPIP